MGDPRETTEETSSEDVGRKPAPGLVVVHSRHSPMCIPIALVNGRAVVGRTIADDVRLPDERVSREHAELTFDGKSWTARDLGSTNGTFVGGTRTTGPTPVEAPHVVRIGNTLLLLRDDITPFLRAPAVRVEQGIVIGPALSQPFAAIDRAARSRPSVLLLGESGTGKEYAARRFHEAGPSSKGSLVAVNCAAIPEGVAERLLFGARRGAFSGATENSGGYLQAADGGVLFLDELGELSLEVQAKLLRVIETKEVLSVGASRPQHVDVRFCFATNRNLRNDVAAGKFRADLYYRIQTPEVRLPALRERREDIPWLVQQALLIAGGGLEAHAKLVEACLLRVWPGNVRELLSEVREAAEEALDRKLTVVSAEQLREHAGVMMNAIETTSTTSAPPGPKAQSPDQVTREAIEGALEAEGGNLAGAARALGLHRTQLYRRMADLEIPTPGRKRAGSE